ncbi:hypothetical protein [Streptacidiphilus sp. P02-A3a]|uniref:hypothetical protein n=1 Tax=Streptacidiphilus sp. P02-A3a TaxID=2704468 RepID=UPI0015F833BC|nr:hypothetical protein [Streptacidiphilus sp. P02-A3a]QMU70717.1 hypothetical protein GXP74_23420 [Streptacidiphilus sp. P02-A3a]
MASNRARAAHEPPGDPVRESADPSAADVEQIAEGLYGLPPPEFTAAREAAAARARAAGEPAAAERVHRLRRPTQAAWLANLLVREYPDEVRALLELAAGLRAAQDRLDGAQLRELARRRQAVVAALTRQAGQAAARAGLAVGEGPLAELEQTLHAVLTDPAVASAFATGRLTSARDPGRAAGGGGPPAARAPRAPVKALRTGDEQRRSQARQLSDRTAEAARSAEAAAAEAREQLERVTERRARRLARIEELTGRLDRARAEERAAATEERDARARVEVTDREARRARGRARDAADRLRHLDQRAA